MFDLYEFRFTEKQITQEFCVFMMVYFAVQTKSYLNLNNYFVLCGRIKCARVWAQLQLCENDSEADGLQKDCFSILDFQRYFPFSSSSQPIFF